MKLTDVNQYVALRAALTSEKAALEARLAAINRALAGQGTQAVVATAVSVEPKPKTRRGKRAKNSMSMREAAVKALAGKPLDRNELLLAVKKLGYKFTATDPLNSLSTILYSGNTFKNTNGKFSVAK